MMVSQAAKANDAFLHDSGGNASASNLVKPQKLVFRQ
jgi:hypothetical protein